MFKAFVASIKAYIDAKVEHALLKYHAENHGAGSRSMTHALMAKEHVLTETAMAIDEFATHADDSIEMITPQPGDLINTGEGRAKPLGADDAEHGLKA